jgi:hypothetical protein
MPSPLRDGLFLCEPLPEAGPLNRAKNSPYNTVDCPLPVRCSEYESGAQVGLGATAATMRPVPPRFFCLFICCSSYIDNL